MVALLTGHTVSWDNASSGFIPHKSSLGTRRDSLCVPSRVSDTSLYFAHHNYLSHTVDIQAMLDMTDTAEKRA